MRQFSVKKGVFADFVGGVVKKYDLIAPIEGSKQKKVNRPFFKKIDTAEQIFLDKKTYFPVKNYFSHSNEVLFEFDGNKIKDPKIDVKKKVFFGVRKCDLNGIMHQDILFLEENEDPFYKARRDASLLIGYHCKEGDDYCFCNSFELKDFYDLMFYDKGKEFAVEVGSEKGEEFVKEFSKFFKEADIITDEDKKIVNKKELKTTDIASHYHSDDWKKGADKCLSCGACNFLCVNCHCFDISDDVNFDLKTGKRVRKPASCQLRSFTRVAGEHIFRDTKIARFKHRIYHQIQYFKDRHDVVFCTGCGRCIEACPAKIDWVEIINEMK